MVSEKTRHDLEFGNVEKRQLAVKKLLKKMTREVSDLLVSRLHVEKDPAVLEWLCIGVGNCFAFEAAETSSRLLQTSTGDVRSYACQTLGKVGSEKCVPRLQSAASYDNDHDVRIAAMKALVSISFRLPKAAPQIIQALEIVQESNKGLRSGDLSRAALAARRDVEKAIDKAKANERTLFDPSPGLMLPPKENEGTKAKELDQIGKYLKSHEVEPEEVRYIMEVVRRPVRKKKYKKQCKKQGITACQICDTPFFEGINGELYFQMAHIHALKDKGVDALHNLLFLCANCHAMLDMAKRPENELEEGVLSITLPNREPVRFKIEEGKIPKRIR